jgi:hypothetical protein
LDFSREKFLDASEFRLASECAVKMTARKDDWDASEDAEAGANEARSDFD